MKKSLLLYIAIPFMVFIASCGDDEPTGPLPVISFSQDRSFAVVGETITFTNSTTDGATFEWDFGDGNTATTENTTHTYDATGSFIVTLTATGSGGRQSAGTATITVGERTIIGIDFIAVNPINEETEKGWDDDETGPDLILALGEDLGPNSPLGTVEITTDLMQSQLPLTGDLGGGGITLTNVDWVIALLDNDEPFDELTSNDFMTGFSINPVTGGVVNGQTGSGIIQLISPDETFNIQLRFQIR